MCCAYYDYISIELMLYANFDASYVGYVRCNICYDKTEKNREIDKKKWRKRNKNKKKSKS